MVDDRYFDDCVYHMVHFNNLASIFQRRALLSKEKVLAEGIVCHSIANEDVQSLRDRIYIQDVLLRQPRSLHSYVPFYFAKQTPMLYVHHREQEEIIFLAVSRLIINEPGVIFTDGNVTIQQLSRYGAEKVLIVPANAETRLCKRRYSSRGPQGTNVNCSDVYVGAVFLEDLNWAVINDRWFNNDMEKKRIKHAEVLVPDILPLNKIEALSAYSQNKADAVNALIKQCGLEGRLARATARPDLYF